VFAEELSRGETLNNCDETKKKRKTIHNSLRENTNIKYLIPICMQLQSLLLQTLGFCIMSNFMLNSSNSKIVTMEAMDYLNVQKNAVLDSVEAVKVKTF